MFQIVWKVTATAKPHSALGRKDDVALLIPRPRRHDDGDGSPRDVARTA
jgi:hypothetical protein